MAFIVIYAIKVPNWTRYKQQHCFYFAGENKCCWLVYYYLFFIVNIWVFKYEYKVFGKL